MFVFLRPSSQGYGCQCHINLMYRFANSYSVCFTCIQFHQVIHENKRIELTQWGVALWKMCCYYDMKLNALLLSLSKKSETSILPSTEQQLNQTEDMSSHFSLFLTV